MTRREFLRRTAPLIVAGTLPLAGAHSLFRRFFSEPKGWDGRPPGKQVTQPVYVFIWGKQELRIDGFSNVDRMQLEVARSLRLPREYVFGDPGPQSAATMARVLGIPLRPVRVASFDNAIDNQKQWESVAAQCLAKRRGIDDPA